MPTMLPNPVSFATIAAACATQVAAFLAALAFVAAGHKLAQPVRGRAAIESLIGVGAATATFWLAAVAAAEVVAGAGLLIPSLRTLGAALAAAIWSGYGLVLARAFVTGRRDVDCGCSFGDHRVLGPYELFRAGTLAVAALLVAVAPPAVAPRSFATDVSMTTGALALVALYLALDQLMGLRRIDRGAAP